MAGLDAPAPDESMHVAGGGIIGRVAGHRVVIGSWAFVNARGTGRAVEYRSPRGGGRGIAGCVRRVRGGDPVQRRLDLAAVGSIAAARGRVVGAAELSHLPRLGVLDDIFAGDEVSEAEADLAARPPLTPRELAVLTLLAESLTATTSNLDSITARINRGEGTRSRWRLRRHWAT